VVPVPGVDGVVVVASVGVVVLGGGGASVVVGRGAVATSVGVASDGGVLGVAVGEACKFCTAFDDGLGSGLAVGLTRGVGSASTTVGATPTRALP
jgi:hypothetical protein